MSSKQRDLVIQLNQFSDALLIAVVFWVAHAVREHLAYWYPLPLRLAGWYELQFPAIATFRSYKWLYLIILPVCPFVLDVNGYYARAHPLGTRQTMWVLIKSVALCALVVISAMYFLGLTQLSRGVIVLFAALAVVALLLKDRLYQYYLRQTARQSRLGQPVVLVGPAARNEEFGRLLDEHPEWNLRVLERVVPGPELQRKLTAILHTYPVSCVIFNMEQTSFADVEAAILACEVEGVEAWLVADFVRTSIARATVDDFYGKPLLVFRTTPDITWQFVGKRVIDIIGSVVGLVIAGPLLMLPIAILVRLTSPGPILFSQKRSGVHGKRFTMYKFRTMVTNAEMLRAELEAFNELDGPAFKIKDDPRITPLGRFLRKTSLDELAQLWNVLRGDMSLVGPRPLPINETEKFDPWHRRRLSMKPGLTCLWQISGRNTVGFEQWMKLDLQYIDNWSLWLDLKIMWRTVPIVLIGSGAR